MVTSPRAALNTRRESYLPIYLIGRQVRLYYTTVFVHYLSITNHYFND